MGVSMASQAHGIREILRVSNFEYEHMRLSFLLPDDLRSARLRALEPLF